MHKRLCKRDSYIYQKNYSQIHFLFPGFLKNIRMFRQVSIRSGGEYLRNPLYTQILFCYNETILINIVFI